MSSTLVTAAIAAVLFATASVNAETHTIRFNNQCGQGTPQLIQGGTVLSNGSDYTSNGPFSAGIAYLQTGQCGFNGEKCAMVEMTLVNPTSPGSGSSTDITLIAPHEFNVQTSFSYFNGCDGTGANCASETCDTAFFQSDDNQVQVQCETNNVDLLISFCSDATQDVQNQGSGEPASSAAPKSTSAHVASPSPDPQPAPSSVAVPTSAKASPTASAVTPASADPVVNPGPSSVAPVRVASSSAAVSAPASASAASASTTTPNRKTCNANKKRRAASPEPVAAKAQTRAIYDSHRRHHARAAARRHDAPF